MSRSLQVMPISTSEMTTMMASNTFIPSQTYPDNPRATSFSSISSANRYVSHLLAWSSTSVHTGDCPWCSTASTTVLAMMATTSTREKVLELQITCEARRVVMQRDLGTRNRFRRSPGAQKMDPAPLTLQSDLGTTPFPEGTKDTLQCKAVQSSPQHCHCVTAHPETNANNRQPMATNCRRLAVNRRRLGG